MNDDKLIEKIILEVDFPEGVYPQVTVFLQDIINRVREHDGRVDNVLNPMKDAPRNIELLAYHKEGKNYHQVKWCDDHWGMRWNSEYRQYDHNYAGWQPLPKPPEKDNSQKALEELVRMNQ